MRAAVLDAAVEPLLAGRTEPRIEQLTALKHKQALMLKLLLAAHCVLHVS